MKSRLLPSLFALLIATTAWADVEINETTFPDEYFRNWVLRQSFGQDGVLTEDELSGVTFVNLLAQNLIGKGYIQNLKGIEYFTSMTKLSCQNNELTELDLSNNTALQILSCQSNHLTDIILPNSKELTFFSCGGNNLTALDVSGFTKLKELECGSNRLTTLNASGCTSMTQLKCRNNQLTELNVSGCAKLDTLWADMNQLPEIDLSSCPSLTLLWLHDNKLTQLDVSKNTKLKNLWCFDNQLTMLNLSKNKQLTSLRTFHNQIKGERMDALIEHLPIVSNCSFCPVYNNDEVDVMNAAQAAAAKAKGFIPHYWDEAAMRWLEYTGNDTTGISDAERLKDKGQMINDKWYNLAGQRLQKMQKGINIVGNKKILMK